MRYRPIAIMLFFLALSARVFAADNVTPWVRIEPVDEAAVKDLSESYRFMLSDFVQAGGKGRTFLVRSSDAAVAGPRLAVDRLPPAAHPKGASLITRDVKVLAALKELRRNGVPLFLHANDRKVDGEVYSNDELGRGLRDAAFPQSNRNYSMSVAPSVTQDILKHENAHIEHSGTNHPITMFLSSLTPEIDEKKMRVIRRALTEIYAYQAQYLELEKMKREGTVKVFQLRNVPPGHEVERVDFNDVYKVRLAEMQASVGIYVGNIASSLRGMSEKARCRLADVTSRGLAGTGPIETEIIDRYIEMHRCSKSSDETGEPRNTVR